jgi:hypothetical protein
MSELPEAAAPAPAPAEAHAARLKKFKREQLVVDYLNRGVSIVEIAARIGVGEKRMRAIIRIRRRSSLRSRSAASTRRCSTPTAPCRRPTSRRSRRW